MVEAGSLDAQQPGRAVEESSKSSDLEARLSRSSYRRLGVVCDPQEQFLLETLTRKVALHFRKNNGYVSVRKWAAKVKRYQVSSLVCAKETPTPGFVGKIADEILEVAAALHGHVKVAHVVPVPCGSSCRDDCLSVRIAEEIARKLGATFTNALVAPMRVTGGSHPRNSARLQPYKLVVDLKGPLLLIDDVATSGRHLELARIALAEAGVPVFAFAWIGT